MRRVFGPVPSKRLGRSLGVDPLPAKTCTQSCVYCQLGRTARPTVERREYVDPDEILAEVEAAFAGDAARGIDWVTFVGSGEPTLHSGLGRLVREARRIGAAPVAVITNGSLLHLPEVRADLRDADAVLPSLDAGSPALFERLNRPHPAVPFELHLEGLVRFRGEFPGRLLLEVMLVRGENDGAPALREIASAVRRIRPDEVHLNVPTRPPAEKWVTPPAAEGLVRARAILGEAAKVVPPPAGAFRLAPGESVGDALLHIIARHPMTREEVAETVARSAPGRLDAVIRELRDRGARSVESLGARYWIYEPDPDPTNDARSEEGD